MFESNLAKLIIVKLPIPLLKEIMCLRFDNRYIIIISINIIIE